MSTQSSAGYTPRGYPWGLVAALVASAILLLAGNPSSTTVYAEEIRLSGMPKPMTQYYRMTTEMFRWEPSGKRTLHEVYDLWIEYASQRQGQDDRVTCRRFTYRVGEIAPVPLPSLQDWSYTFRNTPADSGDSIPIFGIDQSKFDKLADANGHLLEMSVAYAVFNAFVDFHSFGQVLGHRTDKGNGIQDLHTIGQSILHASAYSEPPISLGNTVGKGSFFRNGAMTLELKGLTQVDGRRCALVGYDSGGSMIKMYLKPAPQVTLEMNGGSHYLGDIYIDLRTQWVRKATLVEFVVSETSGAVLPQKMHSVSERRLLLRALNKEEFQKSRQTKE
jgi:hypothetical protein